MISEKNKERNLCSKEFVFPEPSPVIRKFIKKSYIEMRAAREKNMNKKYTRGRVRNKGHRLCNVCSEYVPTEKTLLLKRTSSSKRRHRICIQCHIEKYIGIP